MRRGSGINPKVYSWWYRNRKVRNRSRASTHIALSDLPWRRYQAAREIWRKEASQHRVDCAESGRVGGGGRLFILLFSRPRRVELEFFQLPRQANQERANGSGLDQNEAQTMAGGLSYSPSPSTDICDLRQSLKFRYCGGGGTGEYMPE